ncbi:MAG: hypothetical protein A2128_01045 [Candidatus Liptonbacteria bacterium GWC1_60_9]|uniref:Uncharacterized protein n=2 Tax=Candidatus Liptoniibacteriota TaxID=1817909 RepID=A0A1G2CBZ7_9BACT|nr:MAG: hypothetical protein A2128_01045 [Candidatus Liptonbacteria bacterium GWC1_60_9]OGY98180.1 MAG: hypothetical protein A3E09_00040 [Candidatus Liptonbacteria bacterium RIFCSPHIGHO2_12_FULL_60_13]HLB32125.1 hypothetical protein [Patescibacteria group bacterium]
MQNKSRILVIVVGILALAIIGAGIFYAARFAGPLSQESVEQDEAATKDETANWKTYRNEEFGFEFRYPPEYAIGVTTEPGAVSLGLPSGLDLEKHTEWGSGSYTADRVFEQVRFGKDMPYEIGEKPLLTTYAIPNFAAPRYLVRVLANGDGTDFVSVQMRTDKLDQFLKETDLFFSEFKFLK